MNLEDQRTSCPGFLDEYGIWNNGFECPSLSDQIRICCGSDSRRYCCLLEHFPTSTINLPERSFLSAPETIVSLIKKISFTFLTLPIQLTCILIIILLLLLTLIIFLLCYRYHKRRNNSRQEEEHLSTKQTLLVDHFPFAPPHHQLFFNENNNPTTKDTLTTSTSSSSAPVPSEIYFNDWKEFFNTTEQSMNKYPTMSSHSNEINNYRIHGNYQQEEIIV